MDFTKDEGSTPVDHTNNLYRTSVPLFRIIMSTLTSLTIPWTRRTHDWEKPSKSKNRKSKTKKKIKTNHKE